MFLLRFLCGKWCKPATDEDLESQGYQGVSAVNVGVTALAHDLSHFEINSQVDSRAIADGDGMTVYVSTTDSRESSCVPIEVQVAAVQRSQARAEKNYTEADAIHKKIKESGYRIFNFQNNEETLARKYRIRLRGIDAPENAMPYGKEAKEELTKIVQGKCLRVLVYGEDQYGRCVADIYCDGKFVQELMLKKGFAWHYATYDQRPELARWEKEAQAKRVGLWASSNPEKPWEWRKKNKKKGQKRIRRKDKSEGG